jgi:hypothetical protein
MTETTSPLGPDDVSVIGPLQPGVYLILVRPPMPMSEMARTTEFLKRWGVHGAVIMLQPGQTVEALPEREARRLYEGLKQRFEPAPGPTAAPEAPRA